MNALIEGHSARIREMKTVDYKDGLTRRWFRVDVDYPRHSHVVVFGGMLKDGTMICQEHEKDQDCECRQAVRNYMKTDPK